MRALRICVKEAIQQEACSIYTADCLGSLVVRSMRFAGNYDFTMPLFSELITVKKPEKTASEIENDIMKKLDNLKPIAPKGGFKGMKRKGDE